jgi:hypothetical protein
MLYVVGGVLVDSEVQIGHARGIAAESNRTSKGQEGRRIPII